MTELDPNSKSRRLLVLGGTGGIGRAIALRMASSANQLHVAGRNQSKLDDLARTIQEIPGAGPLTSHCLDLDDHTRIGELLQLAMTMDILVVSRGAFCEKKLADTTLDDWQHMSYSNLVLPGILASSAAAAMAGRGFGRILLFGGTRTDTIRGYRHNAAYAAAKTGLAVVTKSLANEFAASGVSCALVCPGFVDTEYVPAETRDRLIRLSPRQRLMQPEQIADVAEWLLTGGMDTANGAIINADEGLYSL